MAINTTFAKRNIINPTVPKFAADEPPKSLQLPDSKGAGTQDHELSEAAPKPTEQSSKDAKLKAAHDLRTQQLMQKTAYTVIDCGGKLIPTGHTGCKPGTSFWDS